jgi:hypothetical protein
MVIVWAGPVVAASDYNTVGIGFNFSEPFHISKYFPAQSQQLQDWPNNAFQKKSIPITSSANRISSQCPVSYVFVQSSRLAARDDFRAITKGDGDMKP